MLRFLADESCDFSVVRELRASAFEVVAIIERAPGSSDERVIDLARSERLIVLTEDRDFGRLVFAATYPASGVIYIRFPAVQRPELPGRIMELVRREGERLERSFTVVTPNRIRIRDLP